MRNSTLLDHLVTFVRSQRALAWFLHGQLALFWLLTSVVGHMLRTSGAPDEACRLFLAAYPLLPAAGAALVGGPSRIARHSYLLALIVFGCHLMILFNPQELGWLRHVVLLQLYFSAVALFANVTVEP